MSRGNTHDASYEWRTIRRLTRIRAGARWGRKCVQAVESGSDAAGQASDACSRLRGGTGDSSGSVMQDAAILE